MKEFIEELKYNQNINFEKGLENRVDIAYVIERLENITNPVYDNGYQILSNVKGMKKYINKCIQYNIDEQEEHKELDEILEELSEYEDEDIAYVDYDRPMGFDLRIFTKNDEMECD